MSSPLHSHPILGIPVHAVTSTTALRYITSHITRRLSQSHKSHKTPLLSPTRSEVNFWGITDRTNHPALRPFFLTTPNPEICVSASFDPEFKQILSSSDLSIPDGTGLLWAAHFLSLPPAGFFRTKLRKWHTLFLSLFRPSTIRHPLPERVTGSDLFLSLCRISARKSWSIFLLGAAPGVAEKCAQILRSRYPKLKIAGTHSGSPDPSEDRRTRLLIQQANPDLLFVAYGAPAQEKWIYRNLPKLPAVSFVAGIGGSFDFVAGVRSRAPRFFRSHGLEWLWRLIQEPRRRLRRIYTALLTFPSLVEKEARSRPLSD